MSRTTLSLVPTPCKHGYHCYPLDLSNSLESGAVALLPLLCPVCHRGMLIATNETNVVRLMMTADGSDIQEIYKSLPFTKISLTYYASTNWIEGLEKIDSQKIINSDNRIVFDYKVGLFLKFVDYCEYYAKSHNIVSQPEICLLVTDPQKYGWRWYNV